MAGERVYQAAARLSVTSRRLLVFLDAHGLPHATASSIVSPAAATVLAQATTTSVLHDSAIHRHSVPSHRPTYWVWEHDQDDWLWGHRSWRNWVGNDELTTAEAAMAYGVAAATIRQWAHRGHLAILRREGRTLIFAARAVWETAMATGERNLQPGGPLTRHDNRPVGPAARRVKAQDMETLVTAQVAADAVGVAPSTVRTWRHRNLLTPAHHRGRTPLYLLADVVALARRLPHRPPRKPRGLI